jgi:hypothetical protein
LPRLSQRTYLGRPPVPETLPSGPATALFRPHGPTHTKGIGRPVVLTLYGVDLASIVKTKYFIAHVQKRRHTSDSLIYAVATLRIELGVGVEVVVTQRASQSEDWVVRRPCPGVPLVCRDALIVVADRKAS